VQSAVRPAFTWIATRAMKPRPMLVAPASTTSGLYFLIKALIASE